MNQTLYKILTWLALSKPSLNTDKAVYIEFGNPVDSPPKNLNLDTQGAKIKRVDSKRYLGIICFDSDMRWNEHIGYIYNKTKYFLFIIYKLSKFMTTDTLRMVYYALFHRIIIAWGGAYSRSNLYSTAYRKCHLKL